MPMIRRIALIVDGADRPGSAATSTRRALDRGLVAAPPGRGGAIGYDRFLPPGDARAPAGRHHPGAWWTLGSTGGIDRVARRAERSDHVSAARGDEVAALRRAGHDSAHHLPPATDPRAAIEPADPGDDADPIGVSRVVAHRGAEEGEPDGRLPAAPGRGAMIPTASPIAGLPDEGPSFEAGMHPDTHPTPDDLPSPIERHRRAPDAARRLAAPGRRETLPDHTYDHRMRRIIEVLGRHEGHAPVVGRADAGPVTAHRGATS